MSDAPIFIIGSGRSGTGLFRDLLRSHPRLSFPPESHYIPAYYRAFGDPADDAEARRLAEAILTRSPVSQWPLELEPAALEQERTFAGMATAIYEAWAAQEGKPRWGDKTPSYVTEVSLLAELFPEARFLHIIRDGREVALSLIRMRWGPTNVVTAAEYWRDRVVAARAAGRALAPERYHELRFERLLTEPEPTLRGVCDFLDEDFAEAMLKPTRFAHKPPERKPLNLRDQIDVSQTEKWRTEMSERDRARFEAVAGDALAELGYATDGEPGEMSGLAREAWKLRDRVRRAPQFLARESIPGLARTRLTLSRARRRRNGASDVDLLAE